MKNRNRLIVILYSLIVLCLVGIVLLILYDVLGFWLKPSISQVDLVDEAFDLAHLGFAALALTIVGTAALGCLEVIKREGRPIPLEHLKDGDYEKIHGVRLNYILLYIVKKVYAPYEKGMSFYLVQTLKRVPNQFRMKAGEIVPNTDDSEERS